jgi:hypothetical protein
VGGVVDLMAWCGIGGLVSARVGGCKDGLRVGGSVRGMCLTYRAPYVHSIALPGLDIPISMYNTAY